MLMEVMVALMIMAVAVIPLLASLGSATDSVINTVRRRKMRYLAQIIIADVEIGKTSPDQEEEPYEEGTRESCETWASEEDPQEYSRFEYVVEALRDEMITPGGGGQDEEAMLDAGFEPTSSGGWTRPVSNDLGLFGGAGEGEAAGPEGPMKRLAVIAIRYVSDDPEEEIVLRIMTYLPYPGEEEQPAGGAGAPGSGLGGATPGAPGSTPGTPSGGGAVRGSSGGGGDRGR